MRLSKYYRKEELKIAYIWYKVELQLTDFQKQIIENGIKLQRDMWNYLVKNVNPLVFEYDVDVYSFNYVAAMEEALFDEFYFEFKECGLGTRLIRSVVDRYIKAWKNYFNENMQRHKPPKFHSYKHSRQSLTFVDVSNKIENNTFLLPRWTRQSFPTPNKITKAQVTLKLFEDSTKFLSRLKTAKAKNCAIIRRKNRYFLSVNYECTYNKCVSLDGAIGLDWGLVDYFIDSNGRRYNIPKSATRQLQRIKSLQRVLHKKTKGSKNSEKILEKINNAWFKYTNIKKDYIEKLTLELCRNNKLIAIEDLDLVAMRKKTHKSRRRQMNHNSFSMFRVVLVQKVERFEDCKVIEINQYFPSSQLCSVCGENTGKKDVSIRDFVCPYCGTHHDRDINAAINILNEGKREFAEKQARKNAAKGYQSVTKN